MPAFFNPLSKQGRDAIAGNSANKMLGEYLKSEFPNLELSDLTNRLKEIQTIETRLKDYNEKKGLKKFW